MNYKSTEFLYDIDPKRLKGMKYEEALNLKIQSATLLVGKLVKELKETDDADVISKIDFRITKVHKAISFIETRLKEIE